MAYLYSLFISHIPYPCLLSKCKRYSVLWNVVATTNSHHTIRLVLDFNPDPFTFVIRQSLVDSLYHSMHRTEVFACCSSKNITPSLRKVRRSLFYNHLYYVPFPYVTTLKFVFVFLIHFTSIKLKLFNPFSLSWRAHCLNQVSATPNSRIVSSLSNPATALPIAFSIHLIICLVLSMK